VPLNAQTDILLPIEDTSVGCILGELIEWQGVTLEQAAIILPGGNNMKNNELELVEAACLLSKPG
jgi:hypothetical protein